MDPSVGTATETPIEIPLERQLVLPGRVWAAPSPRALIGIVHGLGEHSARYGMLAGDLVRAGYTVASMDWPGHGHAPGSRGDVRSWTWVRDNVVPALFTATKSIPGQPERLPRIVFGHSMGGLMALDFALAHPRDLAGVAASAPALRSAMPPWWKLALANVALATAPSIGFPHGLPEGKMSRDAEVTQLRKTDPLMHDRISPRLYHGMTEARQRVLRDARRLAVPALLMHSAIDDVVDPGGTAEFAAAAPAGLVKHVTYADAYHEIFNDLGREERVRDLVTWLEKVAARS